MARTSRPWSAQRNAAQCSAVFSVVFAEGHALQRRAAQNTAVFRSRKAGTSPYTKGREESVGGLRVASLAAMVSPCGARGFTWEIRLPPRIFFLVSGSGLGAGTFGGEFGGQKALGSHFVPFLYFIAYIYSDSTYLALALLMHKI